MAEIIKKQGIQISGYAGTRKRRANLLTASTERAIPRGHNITVATVHQGRALVYCIRCQTILPPLPFKGILSLLALADIFTGGFMKISLLMWMRWDWESSQGLLDWHLEWGPPLQTLQYSVQISRYQQLSNGPCLWVLHTCKLYFCILFVAINLPLFCSIISLAGSCDRGQIRDSLLLVNKS